jgi:hypothetical protein
MLNFLLMKENKFKIILPLISSSGVILPSPLGRWMLVPNRILWLTFSPFREQKALLVAPHLHD